MNLTPEEIAFCRFIAEIEAGILEPYFKEVQDGWYSEQMVIDHIPECEFAEVRTLSESVPKFIHTHRKPACIPRYKKELRYRRGT